jgi:hypothetical protein
VQLIVGHVRGGLEEAIRPTGPIGSRRNKQANLILGLPKSYSDRITRFYYYSWIGDNAYNNPPKPNAWDSGLIDWRTNKERPQWRSFKNRILGGAP